MPCVSHMLNMMNLVDMLNLMNMMNNLVNSMMNGGVVMRRSPDSPSRLGLSELLVSLLEPVELLNSFFKLFNCPGGSPLGEVFSAVSITPLELPPDPLYTSSCASDPFPEVLGLELVVSLVLDYLMVDHLMSALVMNVVDVS